MECKKIILDTGSGYSKIGFSKDKQPKLCIPTAIARPTTSAASDLSCIFVGEQALDPPEGYVIDRPMQKGIVVDWDLMEKYWSYIFENGINTNIKDNSIFLTEKFKAPKEEREKKAEIFFENFEVSSMFISNSATTTLWGSRAISGFVIDFGYDFTQIVPMRNGFGFKLAVQDCDLGGKDISDYLRMLLSKKGYHSIPEKDLEYIKKNYCFFSTKSTAKEQLEKEISYQLPDKSTITFNEEKYLCTEIFFTPLFGKGNLLHYFLRSLNEADNQTVSVFRRTVIVSGGNSLFPGFAEQFKEALKSYENLTNKLNVIIKDNREFAQFFGASEHSAESYIGSRVMTKAEYQEWGKAGVYHKFFYI